MRALPTGTVTFLFTDIEGSTRLLRDTGEQFNDLLAAHSQIMREAIAAGGGVEVRTEGDAFFVAYSEPLGALITTVHAQRGLAGHPWPPGVDLRVRMGMHTGSGVRGGDDYVGIDVHRAARIASAAHGGQVVASHSTARLIEHDLPSDVTLRDLGDHRLKDIEHPERIFQVDISGLSSEFPPLSTLEVPTNLPADLTDFVGREKELTQAVGLLGRARLLTLTGPGGAGKTRLALRTAGEAREAFGDGVFFVGMEEITEATDMAGAISDAIGAPPASGQDQRDRLTSHVGTNRMLIVLDNLEQIDDPGSVVGGLLGACPNVKVLATSRVPLRVSGEQEMPVPMMAVPEADGRTPEALMEFDSVALFARRASAVRPDFEVNADNAQAVAALCARLDGLPLAIEIAAARVKLLPPTSILERLDNVLDTVGSRDVPARQRTLRGAIAWSHDLLDAPIRLLFERLSVFAGGAWLPELESVAADADMDPLEGISQLVDHSLLSQSIVLGEPRFRMLETIREFAVEQLAGSGEADRARARHAEAYLALAERVHPELTGPEWDTWIDRLTLDRHNFEAALDWSIGSAETETAQRLCASLWRFWQMRGHMAEALPRIEAAIAMSASPSEARARAVEAAGGVAYWLGDMERTRGHYEDALQYWRDVGDDLETANALHNLSYPVGFGEGAHAAIPLLQEALAVYERLGDRLGMGRSNRMLGIMEATRGNPAAWGEYARRSLEYFDAEREPFDVGWALMSVAGAAYLEGDIDTSESALRRGLELFKRAGDVSALIIFLTGFAHLATARGERDRAARLAGAVARVEEETGAKAMTGSLANKWLDVEVLQSLREEHPTLFDEGRSLTPDEAVAYALGE